MLHGTGCSKLSKWRRFATARALRGAESHQWLRRCRPTDELRRSPIYSSWAVSLMHRDDRLLVRHLDANWKCCRRCLGWLYICTSPAVEFRSRDGTARCERALRLDEEQSLVHITHTHTHWTGLKSRSEHVQTNGNFHVAVRSDGQIPVAIGI